MLQMCLFMFRNVQRRTILKQQIHFSLIALHMIVIEHKVKYRTYCIINIAFSSLFK